MPSVFRQRISKEKATIKGNSDDLHYEIIFNTQWQNGTHMLIVNESNDNMLWDFRTFVGIVL